MGHVERLFVSWWLNCWEFCGSYLSPFSASYLIYQLSFFVCRSCKKTKDERKETKVPLNSNIFGGEGSQLFCGVEYFPEPVEIVLFSPNKVFKYIIESFLAITSLKLVVCSVGMFNGSCYK